MCKGQAGETEPRLGWAEGCLGPAGGEVAGSPASGTDEGRDGRDERADGNEHATLLGIGRGAVGASNLPSGCIREWGVVRGMKVNDESDERDIELLAALCNAVTSSDILYVV